MSSLGIARVLNAGAPTVVLLDELAEQAYVANVDGQSFSDLPEMLAATNGDSARIEQGAEVTVNPAAVLPPVARPTKIICLGQNYRAHVAEAGRTSSPPYPDLFPKWESSLAGPYQDLELPPESQLVDFESELVVVIGQAGRRLAPHDATQLVFGYTLANDVSVRDFQVHTPGRIAGKAWDGLTPLGPRIIAAGELGGAHPDLRITGRLNGEIMQDARTSDLLFDIPHVISYVSTFMALSPGDLILTGTPSGVGYFREPRVMLSDNDVFEVTIEGIGSLRNRFVATSADG